MAHSNETLQNQTKKEIYAIARELAEEIKAKGYRANGFSKLNKTELIKYILDSEEKIKVIEENETVETVEGLTENQNVEIVEKTVESIENLGTTEPTETVEVAESEEILIPSPEEFFKETIAFNTEEEVVEARDLLIEKLEEKYTPATVSKKLSEYKKPFYSFIHPNPKLNQKVQVKGITRTQHIAAKLLVISSEAKEQLDNQREKSGLARLGFDEEGGLRKVELPETNTLQTVNKASKLLISNDPLDITCGILPLTGLRKNEFQFAYRDYENNGKKYTIQHEIRAIGENLIAVRGISKKHGDTNWYVRVCLINSDLICAAREKYLAHPNVKKLSGDYSEYNNSYFRKSSDKRFKEIWGEDFSTIEVYDESGKRLDNNATAHKARSFYAWALVPVLKANGFTFDQAKKYIQKCLGHDNPKDTDKYFARYNEMKFTQDVDLDIPLKIKELDVISEERVNELAKKWKEEKELQNKEEKELIAESQNIKEEQLENLSNSIEKSEVTGEQFYNLNTLIEGLQPEDRVLINQFLVEKLNPTEAILKFISLLKFKNSTKNLPTVVDRTEAGLKAILIGILDYNSDCPEWKERVYPTYSLVRKINKKIFGKDPSTVVFERVFDGMKTDILERLAEKEIGEDHNSKNRKGMDGKIDKIITYTDLSFGNG